MLDFKAGCGQFLQCLTRHFKVVCSTGLKQCGGWYVSILVTWLHALTVSFSASIDGSHVRSKTTIKAFTNYLLSNNIAEFFF